MRFDILNLCVEMGNRLPQLMKEQLLKMVQSGVTVPSLSHYVQYNYLSSFIASSSDLTQVSRFMESRRLLFFV